MNETVRINVFAPTHKHANQQIVWDALKTNRWVMVRAGRKWRKTSLSVSWLVKMALKTDLTCPFIAPNRTQAKNIVWDDHIQRFLTELREKGVPYKANEQELSIKLPRGKIQLLGVENKDSLRGISNWGAVAGDEYDDWEEDIWPTIIRPNLITHNAPALITGTPKGFRNLYRLENGGLFKPFHFTSMDNPELDPQELEDLRKEYMAMGMGAYRQEILAEYEKPEGTVYEEWDMDKQYIPFGYVPALPLHLAWDFGVNDPTAILFLQPNGSDELRLVDYYEASDASIEHFTQWIKERGYNKASFEAGDIAGRQRSLITGKSVIAELRNLGHSIRSMPIPDIETQIRNTHKVIPKLFVSSTNPRCKRFVECIVNYRYPKRAETMINQENENPIHDEFSHALRALEYYCWNIADGRVGGIGHTTIGNHKFSKTAWMDDQGKQHSVTLDAFANVKPKGGVYYPK